MSDARNELDRIEAEVIRALASPIRLAIVHLLGESPCEVWQLAERLGASSSLVSQHLAALRAAGLVEPSRDGRSVRYSLVDPDVVAACDLMREVIVRRARTLAALATPAPEPSATLAVAQETPA